MRTMRNIIKDMKFFKQIVNPKTFIGGKKLQKYFQTVNKDMQKCENIYRAGGIVSQAIDAYPLFGMSGGYEVVGAGTQRRIVEDWLYDIDIEGLVWQAWVDALVYGDAIQENVYSRGKDLLYLVPRNPKYFTIEEDEWGMITGYTQRAQDKKTVLTPRQVTNLALIPLSGETGGQSLIQRALDDIMRDTMTAESTAIAIQRHGYPRFHIKCGSENSDYNDEEKKAVAREFEELKADNEFITDPDIDIVAIDAVGVGKVNVYNEVSLGRMMGALGVPSEVVGTGQNVSTYATASVEMVSFIKKVETQQRRVERCFNGMIDLKTGMKGQIKIVFNPVDRGALVDVEG